MDKSITIIENIIHNKQSILSTYADRLREKRDNEDFIHLSLEITKLQAQIEALQEALGLID